MHAPGGEPAGLLLAVLMEWARPGLLAGALLGLVGCQALPQLPETPSQPSVTRDLVAGAAASFCEGALEWLKTEPARDIRLEHVAGPALTKPGDRTSGIELVLRDVRDLPLPRLTTGEVTPMAEDGSAVLDDPRSRFADLSRIAEATVLAADQAYDIRERSRSSPAVPDPAEIAAVARELPGYIIRKLYIDDFSGLKAFVLESRDATHRIYAIAGTQVFVNRDYRDWASGLMMAQIGRAHV